MCSRVNEYFHHRGQVYCAELVHLSTHFPWEKCSAFPKGHFHVSMTWKLASEGSSVQPSVFCLQQMRVVNSVSNSVLINQQILYLDISAKWVIKLSNSLYICRNCKPQKHGKTLSTHNWISMITICIFDCQRLTALTCFPPQSPLCPSSESWKTRKSLMGQSSLSSASCQDTMLMLNGWRLVPVLLFLDLSTVIYR